MIELYGLKNCDSCRAARRWLEAQNLDYRFHDLRENPPTKTQLSRWLKSLSAEVLVNRQSAAWRGLSESERALLQKGQAAALISKYPALIKRPLIERGEKLSVGFGAAQKAALKPREKLNPL